MKISRIIFKQEQPGGGTLYRAECTDVFNNWKEQYKSSCVADVEAEENPVVYIQGVLQDGKCVRRKIDGTIIADTKRVLVFSKAPDGLFFFYDLTRLEAAITIADFENICNYVDESLPNAELMFDLETYGMAYATEINRAAERIMQYYDSRDAESSINPRIANIIDGFEDFLEGKGISVNAIPNPEREGDNPAIIYGSDYDTLYRIIENCLYAD
jgi:hypothetical protein